MNEFESIKIDADPLVKVISPEYMASIGYLALIGIANKFANTSEREICREIGRVAADIIEPEFARLDRRNLVERKKFLEHELESIRKLKLLDSYEQAFILEGKKVAEALGYEAESLLKIGVPVNTLKAAQII